MASLSPSLTVLRHILDGIFRPISDDSPLYLPDGIFKPISGDLPSSPPNGICKPIPDTTYKVQHHLRRVQISGHSSVQSSSTIRSRKADHPIYIPRFKKIEQGKLVYPKIFPHVFPRFPLAYVVVNLCLKTRKFFK